MAWYNDPVIRADGDTERPGERWSPITIATTGGYKSRYFGFYFELDTEAVRVCLLECFLLIHTLVVHYHLFVRTKSIYILADLTMTDVCRVGDIVKIWGALRIMYTIRYTDCLMWIAFILFVYPTGYEIGWKSGIIYLHLLLFSFEYKNIHFIQFLTSGIWIMGQNGVGRLIGLTDHELTMGWQWVDNWLTIG